MSVHRYQARKMPGKPANDDMTEDWEVLADGQVVLADVPEVIVIDVVEALELAYETGLERQTEER